MQILLNLSHLFAFTKIDLNFSHLSTIYLIVYFSIAQINEFMIKTIYSLFDFSFAANARPSSRSFADLTRARIKFMFIVCVCWRTCCSSWRRFCRRIPSLVVLKNQEAKMCFLSHLKPKIKSQMLQTLHERMISRRAFDRHAIDDISE